MKLQRSLLRTTRFLSSSKSTTFIPSIRQFSDASSSSSYSDSCRFASASGFPSVAAFSTFCGSSSAFSPRSFDHSRLSGSPVYRAAAFRQTRSLHTSRTARGLVGVRLADIGEGIAEVELLRWHKKVGESIEEMEAVCEVQSDKAVVEITSRYTGKILEQKHIVGDMVKIGALLMTVDVEGLESDADAAEPPEAAEKQQQQQAKTEAPAAAVVSGGGERGETVAVPAARRLAKELGVDISLVKGSGKGGRITKEDIENFSKSGGAAASVPVASTPAAAPAPSSGAAPPVPPPAVPSRPSKENKTVALRGFARAMVKSMTESAKVPQLNIGDEFDVTDLMEMRLKMKAVVEKEYGLKLTVTPLVVKAVSMALNKHPILNSKLDNESQYTMFGSHNISLAIDTPHGLVVPNIKNTQDLNVMEIQSELLRLQHLAQSNKLSTSDLTGGTVCISNVGVIAGTNVKALLFDNQAMIIGIGRTQTLPRFNDKQQLVPRLIMNCSFTADHRHCDGATVARFVADMKRYLEKPEFMMLLMS